MMTRKQNKIDSRTSAKEPYLHPQPEGLMRVKDYLFTETEEGRCLLLRWVMETDFPVDLCSFDLLELDAADECIRKTALSYTRSDLEGLRLGDVFIPIDGILVCEGCSSIRVQITAVYSANYVYSVKGTRVEVGYRAPECWAYDKKPGREDDLTEDIPLRVSGKRRVRMSHILPVAILTVLLMIAAVLLPYVSAEEGETHPEPETQAEASVETSAGEA